MRITWYKNKIRLVPALIQEACTGCLFQDARDIECPRPKDGPKYCYDPTDESEFAQDHMWIEDSEQGMADYITAKLTGNLPEDEE